MNDITIGYGFAYYAYVRASITRMEESTLRGLTWFTCFKYLQRPRA